MDSGVGFTFESMGLYEFYFPDLNVRQIKKLISHDDYLQAKAMEDELQNRRMNELTGGHQWFTDKSPLYASIATGVLDCNGIFKVIVTPL